MHTRPAAFAAVLWILVGACGPKHTSSEVPDPPATKGPAVELEPIPVEVAAARIDPMAGHDPNARSPLLDIMTAENARSMEKLSRSSEAPVYFLSYLIQDQRTVVLEADGGAIIDDRDDSDRVLDVVVRVGTPELDNYQTLADDRASFINRPRIRRGRAPFGTDDLAVRTHLWLETDRRFREATNALRMVRTDASMSARRAGPPNFAHAPKEVFIQAPATLELDKAAWVERLRSCSRRAFKGAATRAQCRIELEVNTVYYVNSEGTQLQMSWPTAQLQVSVGVKAEDGMSLSRQEQRFARTAAGLPSDEEIDALIEAVTGDLDALHDAPLVDPYVGPAILEGRAAAVFFHEVFGHRIEGHRQKDDKSGQTFSTYVGDQIMADWINVYDDPTIDTLNGVPLVGFYRFDDEGVRARRASLVAAGVLEGFVQGRDPLDGFPESNGHGRKQASLAGLPAVSRQGNLVVEATRSVDRDTLYQQLIAEIERQGRPFGMVFTDISGGFTNTSRVLPQSFKVQPVMAYRIYPDGRRELVRGVDIVGTPLAALQSIVSAGRPVETFNGICGAESGWVPVSASAPSLLLRQVEVERSFKPDDRPPVLPPPAVAPHGAGGDR
jgi:TldD protein